MGRRDEKKDEVRSKIIRAALPMFEQHGFENTTFEQIADRAGVSVRTCTRHFAGKMDIVFTFHKERLERFRATLERNFIPENPVEGVRLAFIELAQFYEEQSADFFREWKLISASPSLSLRDMELDSEYEAALTGILMRGRFSEAESAIIAATVFMSVRACMNQWYEEKCRRRIIDLGQFTFSMLAWLSDTYKQGRSLFDKENSAAAMEPGCSPGSRKTAALKK